MEKDVSRWYDVESVPQSHTFPLQDSPGKEPILLCTKIPIIDIFGETTSTVEKIIKASQKYGFFQVINHEVGEDVICETVKVLEELFSRSAEEISKEANENGWVYMGSNDYPVNGVHLWRDNIKHKCHPFEESMQHWPQLTKQFEIEVVGTYIKVIGKLSLKILELISEGLRLENEYLGEISQVQFLTASNYPRCPDPTRTLGLLKHVDHSLITILFQGNIEGLQVIKDGKWIGVPVVPNAFVVNIGTQLEIISNGKLRSAEHRVVTNQNEGRTTIATFINPTQEAIIEPAKVCVNEVNPPLYPPFSFKDFVNLSKPFGPFTHVIQN